VSWESSILTLILFSSYKNNKNFTIVSKFFWARIFTLVKRENLKIHDESLEKEFESEVFGKN